MSGFPEGFLVIRDISEGITPKMRLTFHGEQHDPFNVQGVADFQTMLDLHLQGAPGKTTVLLEDSALTPEDAKALSRIYKADGFVNTAQSEWLYKQLKRPLSYVEVLRRRKELAELDLKTDLQAAIDRGLVNPEKLRDYFMMQVLDDNKKRVDVESESHP